MNRRHFIRIGSLAFAALMVQKNPIFNQWNNLPVELTANGIILRGMPGGEIHASFDAGQTWQSHSRLGNSYSITRFYSDSAQRIHAQVAYMGRSFDLVLTRDNRYWIAG